MDNWQFCFLTDRYYIDFPDNNLMKNKEAVNGVLIDRPCFFAFRDKENQDIMWLVPISSQYDKYKKIHDKNVEKYGFCTTIRFGTVIGTMAAFLIQNMCPAIDKYIREIYVDKNNVPIAIDNRVIQDVISSASEVLARVKRGSKLIFPDIAKIKQILLEELGENGKRL